MMFGFALSGLQEFLYDLSPQTQSREERMEEGGRETNAARRLRIRSAVLTLIPGIVAHELKKADDARAEVIYLGGGKLLASASEDAIYKVEPKLRKLYGWLVGASRGALGAYWTSSQGAETRSKSVQNLLQNLNQVKWQAGRWDGKWHPAAHLIESQKPVDQLGDSDWESEEGGKFAKEENFTGFQVGEGGWKISPWNARPVTNAPNIALAGKAPAEHDLQVAIPTYTPKDEKGETILLHELAEKGEGAPYLALLKLDGDKVGELMNTALKTDTDLTKYSQLSKALSDFFGPKLMGDLETKFSHLYLVYSGGDDMVACGHFKDVLEAALFVREEFQNQKIGTTVSAGVSFFSRNSPILKAIEHAEEELENAKKERDSISIGGCSMRWDVAKQALKEVDSLVNAIHAETINRGALQLLRQLGESWLPDAPDEQRNRRWRSIPMMHYMRSRRTGWREEEWDNELKGLFDALQEREDDWPRAALVGTLAAWMTKKRQEEE